MVAPLTPLFALERARLAERMGERERALREYSYVARAWRKADPELRSYKVEAEQAVAWLGGRLDAPRSRAVPNSQE